MNNNKAAVTVYGNVARRIIRCQDHNTFERFNNDVDNLKRLPREFTNTRDGLEKGQLSLENDGCGNNNTRRIIILITDGLANRGIGQERGLYKAASEIKAKGTVIQAIAVGKDYFDLLKNMIPVEDIYRVIKIMNHSPKFLSDFSRKIHLKRGIPIFHCFNSYSQLRSFFLSFFDSVSFLGTKYFIKNTC